MVSLEKPQGGCIFKIVKKINIIIYPLYFCSVLVRCDVFCPESIVPSGSLIVKILDKTVASDKIYILLQSVL